MAYSPSDEEKRTARRPAGTVLMLLGALLSFSLVAQAHGPARRSTHRTTPDERKAYQQARPVFDKHCSRCHTKQGTESKKAILKHLDMSRYPFAGHHANEVAVSIRRPSAQEAMARPPCLQTLPGP